MEEGKEGVQVAKNSSSSSSSLLEGSAEPRIGEEESGLGCRGGRETSLSPRLQPQDTGQRSQMLETGRKDRQMPRDMATSTLGTSPTEPQENKKEPAEYAPALTPLPYCNLALTSSLQGLH